MVELTIDLREGFFRTPVTIRIDGKEVFRQDAVTTRMQISRAELVCVDVPIGAFMLTIELPKANQTLERRLELHEAWFVAVDLDESGALSMREGAEPFKCA